MIQKGTVPNCTFFTASFFEERFSFTLRRTNHLWDATFRDYSAPLRTLNVELVLIAPYGVERSSDMRRS